MCYVEPVLRLITTSIIIASLVVSLAAAEVQEVWYRVTFSGATVGFAKERTAEDDSGQFSEHHMEIQVSRLGTQISMVLRMEELDGHDGRLKRYRSETVMNGSATSVSAERRGHYVYVEEKSGEYVQKRTIKWEKGALGSAEVDRLVRESSARGETVVTARVFDAQQGDFQTKRFEMAGRRILDGVEHVIVDEYIDDGKAPSTTSWYDPRDWSAARVEINQLGIQIMIDRIEADEVDALQIDPNFDVIRSSMIAVEGYPDDADAVDEVTFRLTFSGPSVEESSLAGPNQRVSAYDERVVDIIVSRESLETTPPEDPNVFLESDRYIQAEHPRVRALADSIVTATGKTGAELARELQIFVNAYITEKSMGVGFGSAIDVLNSREGDCTEHAVLLTAMMRAAGIPSRVAVGVAYARGFLVGHMWAEAFVDGWRTYDALDLNNSPVRIRLSGSTNERALNERDLVNAYGLLGGLNVEVVDYRLKSQTP